MEELRKISPEEVRKIVEQSALSRTLPQIGYHHTGKGEKNEKTESCKVDFGFTPGKDSLSFLTLTKGDGSQEHYRFRMGKNAHETWAQKDPRTDQLTFSYLLTPEREGISKGDVHEVIFLGFDLLMTHLTSVYVSRMYCLETRVSNGQTYCGSSRGPAEPPNYTCSLQ